MYSKETKQYNFSVELYDQRYVTQENIWTGLI